jgi:archaellum biogenesis protein FlaJ (TadC family)
MNNTIFLVVMTAVNIPNAVIKISNGTPWIDTIFWGALFLWGSCLGMWLEKRLGDKHD